MSRGGHRSAALWASLVSPVRGLTHEAGVGVSPTGLHFQGRSCTGVLLLGQWRWETGLQATTAPPTHRPCATAEASAWFCGAASAASPGCSLGAGVLPGLGPRGTAQSSGGLWGQHGVLETGRTAVSVLVKCPRGRGEGRLLRQQPFTWKLESAP